MSRPIKFRALDKETGNWEYFVIDAISQIPEADLGATIGIGSPIWHQIVKERRIDFSTFGQFTGHHDKNGTEIYEGDLLTDSTLPHDPWEVRWIESETCFGLFHLYSGKWCAGNLRPFTEKLSGKIHGVIIGNIYENPELLP